MVTQTLKQGQRGQILGRLEGGLPRRLSEHTKIKFPAWRERRPALYPTMNPFRADARVMRRAVDRREIGANEGAHGLVEFEAEKVANTACHSCRIGHRFPVPHKKNWHG